MGKKIYFRADAGAGIGYGHFIRSLALADMLKSDFECVMFTQEPTPYQISEAENVCPLVSLPADESKFEKFLEYLTGEEIVVLDNYFYTTDYQQQIKDKGCKLVCIDDMHDKHFVADVVINHGVVPVEAYDVADYTQVFTSPKYALLRSPFLQFQPTTKRSGSWVVTIGGLDEPNITTLAVKTLQEIGTKDITAIVGDGFKHCAELEKTGVKILSRLTAQQMAETFAAAENVLCCASTVCYEALSQGCKVYAGWYVDNQLEIYAGLKKNRYVVPLEKLAELESDLLLQNVQVTSLPFNKVRSRIKGIFVCLASEMVNYIDMSEEQSRQVWECRNIKEIRDCMTNPNPFSFESHQQFVQSLKKNTSCYVGMFFNDRFAASYDLVGIEPRVKAERGLFVNPEFQGMGLGEYLEKHMVEIAKTNYGVHWLLAEVLKSNPRSLHYHKAVGYNVVREDDTYYYMEKEI